MNMNERIETLRRAGFTVRYADIRNAYSWAEPHVGCWDLHDNQWDGDQPYVDFGDIASGEDYYDQTSTVQRSNFRRLLEDYGRKFCRLSFTNVDALGAFVSNLDEDLIGTIVGLREQYPIYDESDMSELETEEITESWDRYLYADSIRDLPEELRDRAEEIGQERLGELFWEALSADDYYPEHSGLEVIWDDDKVREILTEILTEARRSA